MESRDYLTALAIFTSVVAASTDALAAQGKTPGQFGVSPWGSAQYAVPIWVPPGPRGIQPQISLSYDSQSGVGPLGVGWSINGLGAITRCNQTVAQDATAAAVALAISDGYCINGNRMRLITGTYGAAGSTYQTEIADFSLITANGAAGSGGPASFTVKGHNGLTYQYGLTDVNGHGINSQVLATGSTTAISWLLSKVSDRSGNNYVINYLPPTGAAPSPPTPALTGASVPDTILWTPTGAGASTYTYTMKFNYAATPNAPQSSIYSYVAGTVVANAELLSSVEILAGATVLRDYFLGYQSSPATGREELISLKECADAAQTNCLLPSSVSYAAPTSGVTTTPATALTSSGLFQLSARYDLNGDGIPDLVYFNGTSWFVAFGSTAGYGTPINTGIGVVSHVLIGNSSRIMPTYWRAGIAAAVLSIVVAVCLLSNAPPGRLLQFASPTTPNADKEDGKADDRAASLPHRLPARYANAGSESYASGALANQSRIDSSVIGRPFALSASMQAELNKSDAFRPARERLVQMARESREIEWANSEEQKIQDLLTSDELVVRNIECRASICAVEVASAGENFDVVRIEQQLIRLNVWGPEYLTFSKDIDDDGNNVKEALFEIRRL